MHFHHCPLVAGWQRVTDDEELIERYCDIAMEGDRGIFSNISMGISARQVKSKRDRDGQLTGRHGTVYDVNIKYKSNGRRKTYSYLL